MKHQLMEDKAPISRM